jgi:hypothetical protein
MNAFLTARDAIMPKRESLLLGQPLLPKDQPLWACVLGPREMSVYEEVALALAVLVNRLGIAKQIVDLLRDAHTLAKRSQARHG